MVEMSSIMSENSCNFNWLLTLLLCSLFSSDQSLSRTLHWTPFKCFGLTLSWTPLPLLLLQLNHQLKTFLKDNQCTKMTPSWTKLCGEMSSDMLFIKLLFWSSLSLLVKELLLLTIPMNASILLKLLLHHQCMSIFNATLTKLPVKRLRSITHSTQRPCTWMMLLSKHGPQLQPSQRQLPHFKSQTLPQPFWMNSVALFTNKSTLKTRALVLNCKNLLNGLRTLRCHLMLRRWPELPSSFTSPMFSRSLFSCNSSINSMLDSSRMDNSTSLPEFSKTGSSFSLPFWLSQYKLQW